MPSVRSLISLSVAILVISLVASCLSMLRPPDSGGRGRDSYGTEGLGYRGLFDTLDELGVTVERRFAPPGPEIAARRLALLGPDPRLSGTNPVYLRSLSSWLNDGGRLMIATRRDGRSDRVRSLADEDEPLPTLTEIFDLDDVRIEPRTRLPDGRVEEGRSRSRPQRESLAEEWTRAFTESVRPPQVVDVDGSGSLSRWSESIRRLAIPGASHQTLTWETSEPDGTIGYLDADGNRQVLAAEFARGNGSIVLVADSELLSNRHLGLGDNSLFAVRLLTPDGGPVVFDEFYHGLGVRGNPLYLLTRPGFATVAAGILAGVILLSWRRAVMIGPPLADPVQPRRDIGEYLNAMGHFFSRGRVAHPFLVEELREGVVRELNIAAGLPPENRDLELVVGVIARRDVGRAERIEGTLRAIDADLQTRHHWTESHTLDTMRRLTACL